MTLDEERENYLSRFPPLASDRQRHTLLPAIQAIDADWMTRLLQPVYPGLVVEAMTINEVIGGRTTKIRAQLVLNDSGRRAGLPEHICLKSNQADLPLSVGSCMLEARFYRHIAHSTRMPTPAAAFAAWDERGSGEGLVIMEDLQQGAGTFGTRTAHLGVDEVAEALEDFANLHASLWESPRLSRYEWLPVSMARNSVDAEQYAIGKSSILRNIADPACASLLPEWLVDNPARLGHFYDRFVAQEQAVGGAPCLIHGDAHPGNSFVRNTGERVWFDWKLVRKGHPWRDVACFMIAALTVEDRRSAERHLLQHYLDDLAARGLDEQLPLNMLWDRYRCWPLWGMVSSLADADGQSGPVCIQRFYQAAEDLETLALVQR